MRRSTRSWAAWNWRGTPYPHRRDGEPGYEKYDPGREIIRLPPAEVAERVLAQQPPNGAEASTFMERTRIGLSLALLCLRQNRTSLRSLRYARDGSHMDVLLCFRCREWAFVLERESETEGPFADEDFDPVLAPLTRLAQALFPDDEAIAALP